MDCTVQNSTCIRVAERAPGGAYRSGPAGAHEPLDLIAREEEYELREEAKRELTHHRCGDLLIILSSHTQPSHRACNH